MLLSKCAIRGSKKLRFLKKQEVKGFLSIIGPNTPLSKIPILLDCNSIEYKMNDIVNKFLLAGDKFMPEMHLKQPGFAYSGCGPFTKNKERF